MSQVAVLMSGGIDSSAAALVLAKAGYDLLGLTARMWPGGSRCCGDEDVYRAQRVCHKLGIPHRVIDVSADFEKYVVGDFVRSYLEGRTPNPCALCNRDIKFGRMLELARGLGFERVASGHYARLKEVAGRPLLAEPADSRKSQVYFLALVSKAVLPRLEFPLGTFDKSDARGMVKAADLPARETESQDLCFVASGKYDQLLKARGAWPGPGEVVDLEGRVVAKHKGHVAYTIGQRFGLKGRRLYVLEKCAAGNRLTVGERGRALAGLVTARPVNYFSDIGVRRDNVIKVKYRYNSPAARAVVCEADSTQIKVRLLEPCFAPAPGQILACYDGDVLVCGGVIAETEAPQAE